MAIDSRRKRASVASLGLLFLGASVVPDGSFAVGDRQAIASSYYGIDSTVAWIDVGGGTAQLPDITSSGAVTLEINAGGEAALPAYTSTGTVTLEINLGGTGQLGPYTASGEVQPTNPASWTDAPTTESLWAVQNPTATTWDNGSTSWDLEGNVLTTVWDGVDDVWADEAGSPTTWVDA